MASKRIAVVEQGRCVACGACENVCPRKAIGVYKGCYARVDLSLCVGCGKCGQTCPAGCIRLPERTEAPV